MKKIILILTIASGVFLMSSCKKDFLTSLATNPNTPSADNATPALVLAPALVSTASIMQTDFNFLATWFGAINWKGGFAITGPTLTYVQTTNSNNGQWFDLYYNLSNYNFIEQSSKAAKNEDNYVAIAMIMKAVDFECLVDNFNDVPYSDALNAAAGTAAAFFPKYDKAATIYADIVGQLDTAIDLIQSAKSNSQEALPGSGDVMFGGNMTLWSSFANTVKLRILLQQSEMAGQASYITGEIAKTASTPYLGVGQNAFVQPGYSDVIGPNGSSQQNPFYADYGFNTQGNAATYYQEQGAGQAAINFLNRTHDSVRLGQFYTTVPDTSIYAGDYFGLLPAGGISNFGTGLIGSSSQPAILLSACESLFIQAEATLRGWLPGGDAAAQNLYNEAVTESFAYENGDYAGYAPGTAGTPSATASTNAAAYLAQAGVKDVSWIPGNFNANLRTIIMQKWIAMNANCPMVYWNDYRRLQDVTNADGTTGLPDVPMTKFAGFTALAHIPFRVYYPQDEYNKNGANVPPAPASTIDLSNTKVFWMP